jgi:hypothetical protein
MKHTLKGITSTKTVYLNGKLISPEEIKSTHKYDVASFDWGIDNIHCTKLAIAIMLTLTDSTTGYKSLKNCLLLNLNQKEDFDIEFEHISTARRNAMRMAHSHNKFLTTEFLMKKSDKELCCFVHPFYREDCEMELGLRTERLKRL